MSWREAAEYALWFFAACGVWSIGASVLIWASDRSGNSGRAEHWTANERLGPPLPPKADDQRS